MQDPCNTALANDQLIGAPQAMGKALHMMKLAVGIRDVAHLREAQARRLAEQGMLRHLTRSMPRRAAEIVDGGSMYWVIAGAMVVRQRITDIVQAQYEDGSACAAIHLDPVLVAVAGRPTRPFQGWRYLAGEAAPADIGPGSDEADLVGLPEALRRELRELCLL
jgi:hypothetical protein